MRKLKLQGNYQKVDGNNAIASPIGGAPQSSAAAAGTASSDRQRVAESLFQREKGEIPIKGINKAINGTNTALK